MATRQSSNPPSPPPTTPRLLSFCPAADGPKSKKKRKRKPLLPKGVDPNNPGGPPDPERWLPKWQRSDFRKKKRGQHQRAQAANVKGSQGAGKVDENLDRSSVPLEAPAAGPSSGKAGGKKGGKKGKR